MNGQNLLESLGYVDEAYIAEAEKLPARRRNRWVPVLTAAACLALVLTGTAMVGLRSPTFGTDAMTAEEMAPDALALGTAGEPEPLAFAAPRMLSVPAEMTVRVLEQTEEILVCVVVDPGTGDYRPDDTVRIAAPPVAADTDSAAPKQTGRLLRVSYYPSDDSSEAILAEAICPEESPEG